MMLYRRSKIEKANKIKIINLNVVVMTSEIAQFSFPITGPPLTLPAPLIILLSSIIRVIHSADTLCRGGIFKEV